MFSFIKKLDRQDKQALFTCFFAFFCNGTLALMMGSVMPDLKVAYNLSDTTSGLFISAHSAGNLIAGLISGLIPLWLGQKRSIFVLSGLAFVGYLMTMTAGWPAWLFLAFLLSTLWYHRRNLLKVIACVIIAWFGVFYNILEIQMGAMLLWTILSLDLGRVTARDLLHK